VTHDSGLLAFIGPPPDRARGAAAEWVGTALDAAERAGAGVVVVDIDCDLGERCVEVLQRCDTVHVTLTPNAGGVLDAYRSTAVLRRLGLRERIGYVVNRWRDGVDLTEAMTDLGGCLDAEVPEQEAFVHAENTHRPAALDGAGPAAAAIGRLAAALECAADDGPAIPAPASLRRSQHG
jgi:CO dehydrogenase nickel-insertion accessory protein CooC1